MSTATLVRPAPAPTARTSRPEVRPVRRAVPVRGPLARPVRGVPTPTPGLGGMPAVRSCRLEVGRGDTADWRLTDRGIAVVLVLAAMIVVAAVTVIGLTAWQVTGSDRPGLSAGVSSGR